LGGRDMSLKSITQKAMGGIQSRLKIAKKATLPKDENKEVSDSFKKSAEPTRGVNWKSVGKLALGAAVGGAMGVAGGLFTGAAACVAGAAAGLMGGVATGLLAGAYLGDKFGGGDSPKVAGIAIGATLAGAAIGLAGGIAAGLVASPVAAGVLGVMGGIGGFGRSLFKMAGADRKPQKA